MKVYISRDENSTEIWVWLKPLKGSAKPHPLSKYPMVNFQRLDSMDEIDKYFCYDMSVFKKKFGFSIREKTVKKIDIPDDFMKDTQIIKY